MTLPTIVPPPRSHGETRHVYSVFAKQRYSHPPDGQLIRGLTEGTIFCFVYVEWGSNCTHCNAHTRWLVGSPPGARPNFRTFWSTCRLPKQPHFPPRVVSQGGRLPLSLSIPLGPLHSRPVMPMTHIPPPGLETETDSISSKTSVRFVGCGN